MRSLLIAAALIAATPAFAGPGDHKPVGCFPLAEAVEGLAKHGQKFTQLNTAQWEFLRGIYAMNPATPPGLPMGNKAVLVKLGGDHGFVLFVDGDRACTPMDAPKQLLDMLDSVAKDVIPHEGSDI